MDGMAGGIWDSFAYMYNALEAREFISAGTVNLSAYTWLLQDGSHRASYVVVQGSPRVFRKTPV